MRAALLPALVLLVWPGLPGGLHGSPGMSHGLPGVTGTICLDVCTCLASRYRTLNRTLDTVDCSRISARLRHRIALNETYGGNLAVILRRNDIYNTRQIEGLTTLDHLIYLDMSENNLRRFSNVIVKGMQLRALYLDANGFDYIPLLSDYGFLALDILSLANNVIESIHVQAFQGLETLKMLNISDNRLSEIESQWLRGLIELRTLDLSNNIINAIAGDSFSSLASIRKINLRGNTLHDIQSELFAKISHLEYLKLDWNHLEKVPSKSLRMLRNAHFIDLSGNHFTRFLPGTFSRLNVTRLRLNDLSHLVIVDDSAFSDMPSLRVLEIHDNHRLRYVAPQAFIRCPRLRVIHSQNNKLSTFPSEPLDLLPSLRELGVYGNPLVCDCNVHWILRNIYVNRRVSLLQPENTLCYKPEPLLHQPVYKIDTHENKAECRPTIIDLLPPEISVFEEDSFSADCRASGVPAANITWILPDSSVLYSNSHTGNMAVTSSGTLLVSSVTADHHGDFTCVAENAQGMANQTVTVMVKVATARIILRHVRDHSILLTWGGTSSQERYRITCRDVDQNFTAQSEILIQPYWRSYTLQNLKPGTRYQLCISMYHQGHYHKDRCVLARTLTRSVQSGIFSIRRYVVSGVSGAGFLILLIIIISILAYIRHYKNKKRLKELYGDNMSQLFLSSVSSFSDVTTPVTYENAAATYDDVTDDEGPPELKNLTSSVSDHLISQNNAEET